ncbi:MAG: uncharacterized protein QOH15_828 [Gaiellales bacterium]|jgi:uncharacterized protein YlxP (DUF503 family)|nr:uncharacterized protein [Gaiellales bacterium]
MARRPNPVKPRLGRVASGYVGILSFDLHFPEGASLKGKRRELLSLKSDLQRRTGAAVAEVDFHELWQRARLTVAIVDRHSSAVGHRLDEAERLVVSRAFQAGPFERGLVAPEDLQ